MWVLLTSSLIWVYQKKFQKSHSPKVNLRRRVDGVSIRASTTRAKEAIQRRITHQMACKRWLAKLAEIPMGTFVPRQGTFLRNCLMEGHFSNTGFTIWKTYQLTNSEAGSRMVLSIDKMGSGKVQGHWVNDKTGWGQFLWGFVNWQNRFWGSEVWGILSMTKLVWARSMMVLSMDKMGPRKVQGHLSMKNLFGPGPSHQFWTLQLEDQRPNC